MEEIAQWLRDAREAAGIGIEEVSKDLDINVLYLKNIEEGKIGLFKNIFELKEYVINYAKYLGLDTTKVIDEFNEYLFEYTSRIPVKELEKDIASAQKLENENDKIISPYTSPAGKNNKWLYIILYFTIFILTVAAVVWSVGQITSNKNSVVTISYRK